MKNKNKERTLVILKPDALQRGILGQIIERFERKGLKIVGLKMAKLSEKILANHYSHHRKKPFFKNLKEYMKFSPVVLMVLEGLEAVSVVRKIVGATKGFEAEAGSIRGDFALGTRNIVHASDSKEVAKEEIKRFFSKKEIFDYPRLIEEIIYAEDERF